MRPKIKSIATSWVITFLLIFMVTIFGPTELFFGNYMELGFVYGEFGWKFLLAGFIVSLLLAFLISIFPEKIRKGFLAVILGVSVASYIQIMFLNTKIGQIGVTAEGYLPSKRESISNILIWLIIIGAFFIFAYAAKKKYQMVFSMISGILLAMQVVAFSSLMIQSDNAAFEYGESEYVLDMSDQFTVSSNENIIVLVFDNCPSAWLDAALEVYPDMLECMNDFTYYNNADCNYYGTFPSVIHLLTGNALDTSLATDDYFLECWNNERTDAYYDLFKKNNYKVNVYTHLTDVLSGTNPLSIAQGRINNIMQHDAARIIDYPLLYKTMLKMSMYRAVPNFLKPNFYVDNNTYASIVSYPDNEMKYSNPSFYETLLEDGITIDDSSNYFVFNHLNGTHEFINDEHCIYNSEVSRDQAVCGMFVLAEEYFDQLKTAGVYDDATIIVMTDHGVQYNAQPIFFVKKSGEKHEAMQYSNAPITYDEFVPTIVSFMGENSSDFGDTIYDIPADQMRERVYYDRALNGDYPRVDRYDGTGTGGANIWKKFTYTGDYWTLADKYVYDDYEAIPMVDSYY